MRSSLARLAFVLLPLLASACDPAPEPSSRVIAPRPMTMAVDTATTHGSSDPASPTMATSPDAIRGEVILVVLGKPFPADLLDEVERTLRDEK